MKVYLDDERKLPPAFDVQVATAAAAINLIAAGGVTSLSLDHDLGPAAAGTGYDVALWIEKAAWHWSRDEPGGAAPFDVTCHSANPVGAARINWALSRAFQYWRIGARRKAGTLPAQKKPGGKVDGYKPTGTEWKDWPLE